MDSKYLDYLLSHINDKRNGEVSVLFPNQINDSELRDGLNYLAGLGYIGQLITKSIKPIWSVSIRTEGSVKVADGGFTHEKKLKDSPIESNIIVTQTNNIAKKSLILSIVAVIISVAAIIVQVFFK